MVSASVFVHTSCETQSQGKGDPKMLRYDGFLFCFKSVITHRHSSATISVPRSFVSVLGDAETEPLPTPANVSSGDSES